MRFDRKKLKAIREQQNLKPDQLADKARVSRQAVYAIESGRIRRPSIETAVKLADALGVSVTKLLKDSKAAKAAGGAS